MTRLTLPWFLVAILALPVTACVTPSQSDDDDDDVSDDDDDSYVPSGPWADLSYAERILYMEEIVMPAMEEIFVGDNAADYPGLSCETCHGPYASSNDYAMPAGLYPLDLADFPLQDSDDAEIAAAAEFMDEEVTPIMAELLDRKPKPLGDFGCFSCHEQE